MTTTVITPMPVKVDHIIDARYSMSELALLLPGLPQPEPRPAGVERQSRRYTTPSEMDLSKPGARLAATRGALEALLEARGWESAGGARWRSPDGDQAYADHAEIYPHDGTSAGLVAGTGRRQDRGDHVPRLTIFDTDAQAAWGLPDHHHQLSAWSVLVHMCEGDTALAGRLARHFDGDVDGLADALAEHDSAEELAKAFPARSRRLALVDALSAVTPPQPGAPSTTSDEEPKGQGAEVNVEPAPAATPTTAPGPSPLLSRVYSLQGVADEIRGVLTWAEAAESDVPVWVASDPEAQTVLVMDRHRSYGTYIVQPDEVVDEEATEEKKQAKAAAGESFDPKKDSVTRTEFKLVRVATWVARRRDAISTVAPGMDGSPVAVEPRRFTVELRTLLGDTVLIPDLSENDSLDVRAIVAAANAGVEVPLKRDDIGRMSNVLGQAAFREQNQLTRYATLGWVQVEPGRHVFLAPVGSVDARGIRTDLTVAPPPGSSEDALASSMMGTYGWDRLPQDKADLESAVRSIADAAWVMPKRPEVLAAMLGATFAAPLGQTQRGVVWIEGVRDSGKSLVSTLANAFTSTTRMAPDAHPISLTSSTEAGVIARMGWMRGMVATADDFRTEGVDAMTMRKVNAAMTRVVQLGYSAAEDAKGTRGGGARASRPTDAFAIISGEVSPGATAIESRLIHVKVTEGDVSITRGTGGFDRWRETYADSGLARAAFADYLSWLAARVDELGVKGLSSEADKARGEWTQGRNGRAVATVASLAVGWRYLREWARDRGVEHVLPSEDEVAGWLDTLVEHNEQRREEVSTTTRLLDEVVNLIEAGRAHLRSPSGGAPVTPRRWGWRPRATSDAWTEEILEPGGEDIGWLAPQEDGEHIVIISVNGMRAVWRTAMPDTPYRKGTVIEAMAPLVVAGTRAGERVSTTILPGNQRGYALPLSALAFKGKGDEVGEDEERFEFPGATAATDAPDDWEDEPF